MKPRPFAYFAPTTLDEALALLVHYGDRARPLAGGQSLVQRMNMREVSPEVIVDLNRIQELDWLRADGDNTLRLGAMTRQQRLATDQSVRATSPALTEAANLTAFPTVRHRGTLGGSVANAERGAQLPLLLVTLDAHATIAREGGHRGSPVADLITGARTLTLAPEELLVDITIPPLAPSAGHAMREFRRGHAGPPVVTVVAILELDSDGYISAARLAISGATETPFLRLRAEEAWLTGRLASADMFAVVAEQAATHVNWGDPVVADVSFRRRLTRGLLTRALAASAAMARRTNEQTASGTKEGR